MTFSFSVNASKLLSKPASQRIVVAVVV